MATNPHFANPDDWQQAEDLLSFKPVRLPGGAGFELESLHIHIRDHKRRDLATIDRTLEAHYGGFNLSQRRRKDQSEARRLALEVSYGSAAEEGQVSGHETRVYQLGPEPEPDDIDGRMPSVVTWSDDDMFYLVSSYELDADTLVGIAESLY